eukprot:TRINITY_DN79535_c0_g1_i1.p1 TRINITY_DN79535_c0_g1~~TRINITY_DN79535_c0_g1_i1.p1  ORF type:complete len:242 (+),score=62.94 TRINITY_DN79535_c0_g1_i1:82-807(+)
MKRVLVYGGGGALGRAIVAQLRRVGGFSAISADFPSVVPLASECSPHLFAPLDPTVSAWDNVSAVSEVIDEKADGLVEAVVHVAGGWMPGSANSQDFIPNSARMIEMNAMSAAAAAHLAAKHLTPGGICVLTGARVASSPCPSMLAYAMSKSMVHYITKSIASADSTDFPANAKIASILPVTIDTEANRKAMPGADFTAWTPPEAIALQVMNWIKDPSSLHNGGLYSVVTTHSNTQFLLDK